jgi:uncharacterized protein (DUF305 family)
MKQTRESSHDHGAEAQPRYLRLGVMIAVSFAVMYGLMYAMVDRVDHVLSNHNQLYMAGLMAAAMGVLEIGMMSGMYPNRKLNALVVALSILALAGFWSAIRSQAAIGDRQFLRSMIPHHAGAILMCGEASIRDDEIARLCRSIVRGQLEEIRQMQRILERLDRR